MGGAGGEGYKIASPRGLGDDSAGKCPPKREGRRALWGRAAGGLPGVSAVRRGTPGLSSAQCQELLRLTGWKEEAAATTGCKVRKAVAPGEGRGLRQLRPPASLPPLAAGHRNSPKSRNSSVRAPAHLAPGSTLGEPQGGRGPYAWEDAMLPASSSPTRPENPLSRHRDPDRPVVPASSPPPGRGRL